MSHAMHRLGRFAARRPWIVIGGWLVVAVLVIAASSTVGRDLQDTVEVPGLDSQQAVDLLTTAQSERAGLTAQVVVTLRDDSATFLDSSEARWALADLQARARALPNVLGTSDPAGALAAGREAAAARGPVSPDGRIALVRVQYPTIDKLDPADLKRLKNLVAEAREGSPLQIEMGGDLFFAFEEAETGAGELLGLISAIGILLVAFGSVIAMGLPIAMALLGLALGIGSMSLIAHLLDVPSWAPQLGVMVGLGVGIDYALLLVTRHREHLARGMSVEESVGRAVATAGQTVIFAGGTVIIAILGLAVAGVPFVTAAGVAVSVVVLIMVAAAVTLLPAFLGLAGHWINRLGVRRRRPQDPHAVSSGWTRWGVHVSRNALAYAVGVTILLLALAAPVLDLRLGFPDAGSLPETRTERRAYDLVADGFGPGINGPFVVAVDLAEDRDVVEPLRAAVMADPGVRAVAPPEVNADAGVATMLAFPTTAPQDDATLDTLRRLRTQVFPTVLDGSSARAHVGGETAMLHLGMRTLPILAEAQLVAVEARSVNIIPDWNDEDELVTYAAEARLPMSPVFLDFEDDDGRCIGWHPEGWPVAFNLRGALCWTQHDILSVVPFGSVDGQHPWGGTDYQAWARWLFLQSDEPDWPSPGPGDSIAGSGDVVSWVDLLGGSRRLDTYDAASLASA